MKRIGYWEDRKSKLWTISNSTNLRGDFFIAILLLSILSCTTANKKNAVEKDDSVDYKKLSADLLFDSGSARPVHWGYETNNGPAIWDKLSPVYSQCGEGKAQSPINLYTGTRGHTPKWKVDYSTTKLLVTHNEHVQELINNGHTIQVSPEVGSTMVFNGKVYHLKQFHFHTPSEHAINGSHAPMEIHMVNQADDGSLAVIGVLVQEGKHNDMFNSLIANLPDLPGQQCANSVSIDINANFPQDFEAFHYIGSLTSPPCTENVQWLVLRNSLFMDEQQISAFSSRIHNNSRPLQPRQGRQVTLNEIHESD